MRLLCLKLLRHGEAWSGYDTGHDDRLELQNFPSSFKYPASLPESLMLSPGIFLLSTYPFDFKKSLLIALNYVHKNTLPMRRYSDPAGKFPASPFSFASDSLSLRSLFIVQIFRSFYLIRIRSTLKMSAASETSSLQPPSELFSECDIPKLELDLTLLDDK